MPCPQWQQPYLVAGGGEYSWQGNVNNCRPENPTDTYSSEEVSPKDVQRSDYLMAGCNNARRPSLRLRSASMNSAELKFLATSTVHESAPVVKRHSFPRLPGPRDI